MIKQGIFGLEVGDNFMLNGNKYTLKKFVKKYRPTLGRVLHAITVGEDGKEQWFISNLEVEVENQ